MDFMHSFVQACQDTLDQHADMQQLLELHKDTPVHDWPVTLRAWTYDLLTDWMDQYGEEQ